MSGTYVLYELECECGEKHEDFGDFGDDGAQDFFDKANKKGWRVKGKNGMMEKLVYGDATMPRANWYNIPYCPDCAKATEIAQAVMGKEKEIDEKVEKNHIGTGEKDVA